MSLISMSRFALSALTMLALGAASAAAQTYPAKPVRFVVPFAPGGQVDAVARSVGQRLAEGWKQPVLVENRPGAGGTIASEAVARSPADGYTYLVSSVSLAAAPSMYRNLPYDPVRDLVPVTQVVNSVSVLLVDARTPVPTLKEFVALARAKPGSLNYGSTGIGSSGHLIIELLRLEAGIDLVHVPYKGEGLMQAALLSGEVHLGMAPISGALGNIKAAKLRPIAVMGDRRSPVLPTVPTMGEAGFAGFENATSWISIFAPAGIQPAVLEKIHADVSQAIRTPELSGLFDKLGYDPVGSTPQEFAARFKADVAMFARAVKQAGIKPE